MRFVFTSEVRRGSEVLYRSFSAELSYLVFLVLLGVPFGLCRAGETWYGCESVYAYVGEGQPQPGPFGINSDGYRLSLCSAYLQAHEPMGFYEGEWSEGDQRWVQATPDGRSLVFQSAGDLTAGDTSQAVRVFEYDAVTGEVGRVSRGLEGYAQQASLSTETNASEIPVQGYSVHTSPMVAARVAVSGNGSAMVFSSAGPLTAEAEKVTEAKVGSAYEYRGAVAAGGSIGDAGAYLISGESTAPSKRMEGIDASGGDVFFVAAGVLVAEDTDSRFDVYDARAEGGFLAPDPPAARCVAEACALQLLVASARAPGANRCVGGYERASRGGGSCVGVVGFGVRMPVRARRRSE